MTDFERRVLERLRATQQVEGFRTAGPAGMVLEVDSEDLWVTVDTISGWSFTGPLEGKGMVPFDPSDEFVEALQELVNERGRWSDRSLSDAEGPWEEYVNTGKWEPLAV